jgi:glucan 1,3-beta-glucosidase
MVLEVGFLLITHNIRATDFYAGDGVTDDTAAINRAISDGNRCGPFVCQSSTVTPAIVYFPAGTYIIGNPIIMYYYTQIIGNANSRPVLKANPNLSALALIDASPYGNNGQPGWTSTSKKGPS